MTPEEQGLYEQAKSQRQAAIDERAAGERRIGDLRQAATHLRTEAASALEPLDAAMRADGPDTWTGRRADRFREHIGDLRRGLVGDGMISVRYELENAALHCELRAQAIEAALPAIPPLPVAPG